MSQDNVIDRSQTNMLVPGAVIHPVDLRAIALKTLQEIAQAPDAPAAARGAAARTILEVIGAIGRHAEPPADTSTKDLASMTREEIDAELARMRDVSR